MRGEGWPRIPGRRGSRRDGGVIFSSSGQVKVKREKRGRDEGGRMEIAFVSGDCGSGEVYSLYDSFGIRKGDGWRGGGGEFSRKSDQR